MSPTEYIIDFVCINGETCPTCGQEDPDKSCKGRRRVCAELGNKKLTLGNLAKVAGEQICPDCSAHMVITNYQPRSLLTQIANYN